MSQHPRASIAKMEHARFWMWAKRKEGLSSHLQAPININSYDDSWEEQAFAEDTAAGALGGCVWPPRSYSCTFCRREFRSAQALGGHMNVHRRDRARLKQSPTSQTEFLHQDAQNHNNHLQNPYSLGFQYPSQNNCTLVCTSPNPSSDPGSIVSPSSTSRVSTPTQENSTKKTSLFTPISSSIVEGEHNNGSTPTSLRPLCPNLGEEEKNSTISIDQSGCRAKVDYLKADLSVSLNLVVRRTRPITISDNEEEEEVQPMACKRRRTESALPFFLRSNSNSVDRCSPCSIDELDLELRLGDRPKGQ